MSKVSRQSDWKRPATNECGAPPEAFELILRRRRQMLVHCHLYYSMDQPIITDHTWQAWADELVTLQRQHGVKFGFYDWAFQDWDASTGYQLPSDRDVAAVAEALLRGIVPSATPSLVSNG